MSIIIEPRITEKSVNFATKGKYIFKVNKKATKNEVKKEIARIFKVKVKDINMINQKGKEKKKGQIIGRTSDFKKAIITLQKGEKIKELEVK